MAQDGKVTMTIAACDWISWVPGSSWVVYDQSSAPPDHAIGAYYAVDVSGGASPVTLPCAGSAPGFAQPLPGPSVAYLCNGVLNILALGSAGATPQVYSWAQAPRFTVDPTKTFVAMTTPQGWVNVYKLADGSQLPGTYMAGDPQAMAWSNNGILAVGSSEGLTVWHPAVSVFTVADARDASTVSWLPDNSAVLALGPTKAFRLDLSQHLRAVTINPPALTVTEDQRYYWTSETGQQATPTYSVRTFALGL